MVFVKLFLEASTTAVETITKTTTANKTLTTATTKTTTAHTTGITTKTTTTGEFKLKPFSAYSMKFILLSPLYESKTIYYIEYSLKERVTHRIPISVAL